MLSNKEIKLIKLIKYTPILIVSFICLIITILLYMERNISVKKDLDKLQRDYLQNNKEIIKNEVEKVHNYISHEKLNSEVELKRNLKNRMEEAFNLVNYIYEKYKDKESKEEIISRIKDSLKAIKFNDNRGYYYIYNLKGFNVSHPVNPQFENKYMLDYKDNFGNFVLRDIINDLKDKKESFTTLYWEKPEDIKKQYKKPHF